MAPPLYFFPKLTRAQLAPEGRLSPAIVAQYGDLARTLADVVDLRRDASLAELTGAGPGGHSGSILCALPVDHEPPPRLGYAPQFQTWTRVACGLAAEAELWVGVDTEHPVTAADLRRRKQFNGYEVDVAGEKWTVPVVRDPQGGSGLPRDFVYDDGGKIQERIKGEYLALWEKFARAVWLFFDPAGPWPWRIDLAEGVDLCLAALALNYRVGRVEQNLLGLIDSDTWVSILAAAVDYPTFRDLAELATAQKKTAQAADRSTISREIPASDASTATSPGPGDGSPDTGPAGESCGPSPAASDGEEE